MKYTSNNIYVILKLPFKEWAHEKTDKLLLIKVILEHISSKMSWINEKRVFIFSNRTIWKSYIKIKKLSGRGEQETLVLCWENKLLRWFATLCTRPDKDMKRERENFIFEWREKEIVYTQNREQTKNNLIKLFEPSPVYPTTKTMLVLASSLQ